MDYLQGDYNSCEDNFRLVDIYDLLANEDEYENDNSSARFLASYVYSKRKDSKEWDLERYYVYLLEQLNCFEANFGAYINTLPMIFPNDGVNETSRLEIFEKKCTKLVKRLCPNSLVI